MDAVRVSVTVVLRGIQRGGAWTAANYALEASGADSLEARPFSIRFGVDIRCQCERLLFVKFIRVHWSFKPLHSLRILGHLRIIDLSSFLLRLWRLGLLVRQGLILLRQIQLLSNDWPTIHPVESNEERRVDFRHVGRLDELTLHVVEVGLLVVRYGSNIFKELAKLRWKYIRRKKLFWLDFVLVLHHFLKSLLVCLIPPWQLSNSKITEQEKQ